MTTSVHTSSAAVVVVVVVVESLMTMPGLLAGDGCFLPCVHRQGDGVKLRVEEGSTSCRGRRPTASSPRYTSEHIHTQHIHFVVVVVVFL